MKNILICIASHFTWLFEAYGFRLTNSHYDATFGGQGWVELEGHSMRIRFVSDREKVYPEFAPLGGWPEGEGVTLDLLYRYLTGQYMDTAMVTDASCEFLKKRFGDILLLFSNGDTSELRAAFEKLKRERAKRLFG